jgi:hypothetical protein
MTVEGKIAPGDLDLMFVTDDPAEAAAHIVHRYQGRHAGVRAR